ncbi:MAG TPA: protocatechuate 3,4-dioxygenase subunit alpha [Jatrophihabitans sp.]|jgi:protocatechuate 3,4-dioxygenase alpha subunit|nr:protocatechuate 3,4-dioxygenase subunit alpha [Jatrophihabitans sp.]
MTRAATPGQTVGPFFGFALPFAGGAHLVPPGHPAAVQLTGRVLDGAGAPVPDALLEIWQPDADGSIAQHAGSVHRDGFTFTGWGRAATDNDGRYRFTTVRPGPVADGVPFIAMTIFARGLLDRLFTRVYLPGTADDTLLAALPPDRRRTLIAEDGDRQLRFDIRLQSPDETVFLRYPAAG